MILTNHKTFVGLTDDEPYIRFYRYEVDMPSCNWLEYTSVREEGSLERTHRPGVE